ncbi:hypothetical protein CF327_g4762 [Tilletia walkeri]|nr:hypothetical protein CF327_g4762 [Tilletia walkeri]
MERRTRPARSTRALPERKTRSSSRRVSGREVEHLQSPEASTSAPSAPPPRALMDLQLQGVQDERTYELVVVSQPKIGCAFEDQPLSRIPISPPLIARLRIFDRDGVEITAGDDLPFFTCQVSLLTEDGRSADLVRSIPRLTEPEAPVASGSTRRRATGRKASSPRKASGSSRVVSQSASTSTSTSTTVNLSGASSELGLPTSLSIPTRMLAGDRPAHADIYFDENNQRRLLFIFPEVSVRHVGKFRFQLNLTRLPSSSSSIPIPSFALASIVSEVFTVVERSEFNITAAEGIVSALAAQGYNFPMLNSSSLIE